MKKLAGKADLVGFIVEDLGISITKAGECMDAVVKAMHRAIVERGGFTVLNEFGIEVKDSPARVGRNPQTGEEVQIPARKRIKANMGKSLSAEINA